jgi:RNA polymerase sigma factor (sigma-70 family)
VPDHPASLEDLVQLDDVELVRRAQAAGGPGATAADRETAKRCLSLVLLRHSGTIRAVIAGKVPSDVVDDLESDVSVRFVATVGRGGAISNPAGLLVRMAQRVRADHLDGRRPTASLDGWAPGIEDPELEQAANEQVVEEMLGCLTERQRVAVWERIIEGRSGEEVAAMLSTSRGNIDVIVHRALRRLQQEMSP